ncbi:MAG: alpha-galactosidase [Clostridia bacterium]|nr:alpha-galactosidase [Clostridia bacterium]
MSIIVSNDGKNFALKSKGATYLMSVNELGVLVNNYYGAPISENEITSFNYAVPRGVTADMPNANKRGQCAEQYRHEYGLYGIGDYREPSVSIVTSNGSRILDLRYDGYELGAKKVNGGMPQTRGGETLKITLKDQYNGVKVHLFYTVYDEIDAIVRSAVIENGNENAITVDRAYSFCLDINDSAYEVISLNGAHERERSITRNKLCEGIYTVASKYGVSSAQRNPFLALVESNTDEESGNAYGFNLIYSGSHEMKAELSPYNIVRVTGGISSFDFSWQLNPGECFVTAECAMVYSNGGLGKMSRTFHDLYRNYLIEEKFAFSPRPIVINNWEATYFDFTEEQICSMIEKVKGTGIDTFVLDDGWFGVRNDDCHSLGDWFINEPKLPNGLKPIAECCRRNGLKFGLWFEPEMVNPDSDLFRAHPEWAIMEQGRPYCQGRQQCVLDMSQQPVRDYVKERMATIIRENNVEYVKWDMNRPLTENFSSTLPANRQKELQHRFVLAFYEVLDYLRKTFPDLIIEGCSSGGARFDAGALAYTPQIWTSDNSDAYSRTKIQYGTSICYPLSSLSCHVSASPNHQTGRVTDFKARCDIAYFGATGYELDPTKFTKEELKAVKERNKAYRKDEKLIQTGDLYRLSSPFEGNVFAQAVISKDKKQAIMVAMVAQLQPNPNPYYIKIKGLDANKTYLIEETGETISGGALASGGIRLTRINKDYATYLYHLKQVKVK